MNYATTYSSGKVLKTVSVTVEYRGAADWRLKRNQWRATNTGSLQGAACNLLLKALCVTLLFFLSAGTVSTAAAEGARPPAVGNTEPPDFTLKTLEGKEFCLSSLRGRLILLKLGATWCRSCEKQMEEIRYIGKFLKAKNVAMVEVFLQDSEKSVREHRRGNKLAITPVVLLDDGKVLEAYNVESIPRILFIDKEFKIRVDGNLFTGRELIRYLKSIDGES